MHRGTLYRWIGDRDRLLCDVLWAESDSLMTFLRNRCTLVGVDRILEIFHGFVSALAGSVPLRAYLTHEGPKGLSLITSPAAGVRPRVIAAVQEIINVEVAAGRYRPAAPTDELAAGYTSIVEHCLYSNVINGFAPDLIAAKRLGWLLLRET